MRLLSFARAMLSALGAQRDFRDAVLGDLDEEFAARSAEDGLMAAKSWYLREAARAVPHLLRDWRRNVSVREVRGLVVSVSASLFCAVLVSMLAGATAAIVAPNVATVVHTSNQVLGLATLVIGALSAVVCGYIAARLHGPAPLIGAAALASAWFILSSAAFVLAGGEILGLYRYGAPLCVLLGALTGGVMRAQQCARRAALPEEHI